MPGKTFTCGKCGEEVSKRKSRLVNGERICKLHEEAEEFAQKDHAKFVEKMLKARQETKRRMSRPRHVDPMRRLASFSLLGSLYRAQLEEQATKDAQATEMLTCTFKSKAFSLFFHSLNKHKGSNEEKRVVIQKAFDDFKADVLSTARSPEESTKIAELWDKATEGFIDGLFSRLVKDDVVAETNAMIEEWTEFDRRHDELYDILCPGEREKEQKHREMLEEQAEAMMSQTEDYSGLT